MRTPMCRPTTRSGGATGSAFHRNSEYATLRLRDAAIVAVEPLLPGPAVVSRFLEMLAHAAVGQRSPGTAQPRDPGRADILQRPLEHHRAIAQTAGHTEQQTQANPL